MTLHAAESVPIHLLPPLCDLLTNQSDDPDACEQDSFYPESGRVYRARPLLFHLVAGKGCSPGLNIVR
jgi:hypothetical protein